MRSSLTAFCAVLWTLFPYTLQAQERMLQGQVVLIGEHDELKPAIGQDVMLVESGDTARTKQGGKFRIFLKGTFKPGVKITLAVERKDWRIQYPLDGETRVPDHPEKELIEVRLLPVGSRKFWSADRFEKFIAGMAEKSREQVRPGGKPQEIEFGRYIKDWAVKYGFSAQQARIEIDKWVADEEQGNDLYQLGLKALARKNFGEAGKQFQESAENKVKARPAVKEAAVKAVEKAQQLDEEIIRDFRSSGDAKYNDYQFPDALASYRQAERFVSKEERPQLWAAIRSDIGKASRQIGIRTEGQAIHEHLAAAIAAYGDALAIYTKEQLPQDWARTQNSLGIVLQEQGIRTSGEAGIRLLSEAVMAYGDALTVYTKEQLPQDWAMTQNNLGIVLQAQGSGTSGEAGIRLLSDAVTAYRDALKIRTNEQLPQDWAMTQNNLGNALQKQGSRTSGEAGTRLLSEAVTAYRDALRVYTKEPLPQDWARTQNNLGAVLREQGSRTSGEAGTRLLSDAVTAYRDALTVYTKEQLPQDWAMTQNNLGNALQKQGIRTSGGGGIRLLSDAVTAYRDALTVYTKEQLPQDWARAQNNLGTVLREQGSRTSGEAGTRLLSNAVTAYRDALTVYTKEQLSQDWAMTQNNLAQALLNLKDWRGAADAYRSVLTLYPSHAEAYRSALALHQDKLFAYPEAFALSQKWLEQHPGDLSAQADFAEVHFTIGRFGEADTRIAALLANPQLDSRTGLALRTLHIAALLAMNKPGPASAAFAALRDFARSQPFNFDESWNFEGSKHFIGNEPSLADSRTWLLDLFSAIEEKDAQKRLVALEKIRAGFSGDLTP